MSPDKTTRGVGVTAQLADKVADAAWKLKMSRGAIIREALAEFLKEPTQITGWGNDPGNGNRRLAFIIDDIVWETVANEAHDNRRSQSAAVRIAVNHYINERLKERDG